MTAEGGAMPADLMRALQGALAASEQSLDRGDADAAAAAWDAALCHPAFRALPPPVRLMALNLSGRARRVRYEQRGDPADLDRAIALHEAALELAGADSFERAAAMEALASALRGRHNRHGELADLAAAIQLYEAAIRLLPAGSPERGDVASSLGCAVLDRYAGTGQLAHLERAMRLHAEAVDLPSAGSESRALRLGNLAISLRARFLRLGDTGGLARAITAAEAAIGLSPPGSPGRPQRLDVLGLVLYERYARQGLLSDLDRSVTLHAEAVDLTAAGAPDRPHRLRNLGNALWARYRRHDGAADLDRAIDRYAAAVRALGADSPGSAQALNNLGIGLVERYERRGNPADLDVAIRHLEDALGRFAPDSPEQASGLNNLANALAHRVAGVGDPVELERVIALREEAVRLTPRRAPERLARLSNLALALADRHARTARAADRRRSVRCFRRACRDGLAAGFEEALIAARQWGDWATARRAYAEAAEAYGYGLQAIARLFRSQLLRQDKEAWLREIAGVATRAAYALARRGKLEAALEALEHGRAMLLSEALERDRAELDGLVAAGRHDLAGRYRRAVERWNNLVPREQRRGPAGEASPPRAALEEARAELDAAIAEIQGIPGYERFLEPPDFADFREAARGATLVYLLATDAGGLAILLREANAPLRETLWLDRLTHGWVRAILATPNAPATGRGLPSYPPYPHGEGRGRLAAVDEIAERLWDAGIGAVVDRLEAHGSTEAVFIATEVLGLLPLHAAWTADAGAPAGRRYASDRISFSYAQSARALIQARRFAEMAPDGQLLAVAEPWPVSADPLPNAATEVAAIASLFESPRILAGEHATRAAVLQALPGVSVAHFACHGTTDPAIPLRSGMLMAGDEMLTVADLLALRLAGARLATLSACETGAIGTVLPDEAVGLPSALVQAGFGGVVASLWPVADASTALLMGRFYRLLSSPDGPDPAVALARAQRWLRESTAGQLGLADAWERAFHASGRRDRHAFHAARFHRRYPNEVPFWHPYYWAAFIVNGV